MFGLTKRGRGGKNMFMVVLNSTNETLITMILDYASLHCKAIISDGWTAYNSLRKLGYFVRLILWCNFVILSIMDF